MTIRNAFPISCPAAVFLNVCRRPRIPRKHGYVHDQGPWRPGYPMMMLAIDELPGRDGKIYEATLHNVDSSSDDRCVVARFNSVLDVRAALDLMADAWFINFGGPRTHVSPGGWTPCPN